MAGVQFRILILVPFFAVSHRKTTDSYRDGGCRVHDLQDCHRLETVSVFDVANRNSTSIVTGVVGGLLRLLVTVTVFDFAALENPRFLGQPP